MRGTPGMSHLMSAQRGGHPASLTNRGLVSFWSEHAALRPPSVSCESCPRNTWKKTNNEQPGREGPTPTAKPRAQSPHRSLEGRPHRRTQGQTRSRKAHAQTPTPTPTPTPTHTETKRTRPGTAKGREPKKTMMSTREKRPTRGVAEDSRSLVCHVLSRTQTGATFRRGRNRGR